MERRIVASAKLGALSLAIVVSALAFARDVDRGRAIAATCANCHGTTGAAPGDMPTLAGRPKDDIVRAMRAFKAGARAATVMQQLARGYTDVEIDAVAAWYESQRPQ